MKSVFYYMRFRIEPVYETVEETVADNVFLHRIRI